LKLIWYQWNAMFGTIAPLHGIAPRNPSAFCRFVKSVPRIIPGDISAPLILPLGGRRLRAKTMHPSNVIVGHDRLCNVRHCHLATW
jgi:hypothetical protein